MSKVNLDVISPEPDAWPPDDPEGDLVIAAILCRAGGSASAEEITKLRELVDAYLDHWHRREGRG